MKQCHPLLVTPDTRPCPVQTSQCPPCCHTWNSAVLFPLLTFAAVTTRYCWAEKKNQPALSQQLSVKNPQRVTSDKMFTHSEAKTGEDGEALPNTCSFWQVWVLKFGRSQLRAFPMCVSCKYKYVFWSKSQPTEPTFPCYLCELRHFPTLCLSSCPGLRHRGNHGYLGKKTKE